MDEISSRPIYKLSAIGGDERADAYEIGLTFAREDRKYVEQMAQILKVSDVALFMTITKHIGHVDLRRKTPKELARLIMQKLGRPLDEIAECRSVFGHQ